MKQFISTLSLFIAISGFTRDAVAQAAGEPAAVAPVAAAASAVLAPRQMPKIIVRWACGDCAQNSKVGPLIEQIYEAEAVKKGFAVVDTEVAEIVITEYRQRNPAARVMLGIFAGKDKLATKIVFRNQSYLASDYSANAFSGMNGLCASVAQMAVNQIAAALPH